MIETDDGECKTVDARILWLVMLLNFKAMKIQMRFYYHCHVYLAYLCHLEFGGAKMY